MGEVAEQRTGGAYLTMFRQYWPYLIFLLLVTAYNVKYLPLGYQPSMDEGYLQSLAMRILGGQLPYREFYFFRTPLSIYLQAALIALFGSYYTILAARIFCVIQTTAMVIIVSSVYYSYVRKLPLLLLLVVGYLVGTLMLDFPWYTYDAVFFASIGLVLFYHRRFVLFGVAVFLSGLCKQNFATLIVLVPLLSIVLRVIRRDLALLNLRETMRFWLGFAIPAAVFGIWLLATGRLGAFFANVITLPRECSNVTLSFTLFQNHAGAFLKALPLIATTLLLYFANRRRWFLFPLAAGTGAIFVHRIWGADYLLPYSIVYFTYTVALLTLISLLVGRDPAGASPDRDMRGLWKVFIVAIAIQYQAGLNYSGLVFSHIGAGAAVALALVLFEVSSDRKRFALGAYLLAAVLIVVGVENKSRFVYHDAPVAQLTAEFTWPLLRGIYSTPENVKTFDDMLTAVDELTYPGDPIFVFPDHPALYFLTDRRNPTPVDWYYHLEYDDAILLEAVEDLRRDPPIIVLAEIPSVPAILRDSVLLDFRKIGHFGRMDLLIPPLTSGESR